MRELIDKKYSALEIESINKLAREDPAELVRRSEEYYNNQVMKAAKTISDSRGQFRFVLLCGPSASGKTTTAHKLKHRLIALGTGARVLSMDDFFKGMEHYPRLANGKPDMESVETLDMNLLNACFEALMDKGEAMFPTFDFASQEQKLAVHHVELTQKDVLIMEGIHALNPMVLKDIPDENIFRIYVSVRTKFVDNGDKVLVPKDIRLMRRMVRDSNFRNYPPIHTLRYWDHVVASERVNIDLYRDDVNLKMDNTIDYEVCVWHRMLRGVLDSVDMKDYEEYPQMQNIIDGLHRFDEIDYKLIPKNSLLREFIGDEA
ncbi:MAG: hypothetical protein LBV27_09985 [Oscillospiraceae bacterium]|jgi:uridine kinase|nr:hypothetical protein [Oscillospiraceae bacterium]